MWGKQTSLADRLGDAAKAKQALLEKARAKDPRKDPGFAERQAKRREIAAAREARTAERKAAKLAEKQRRAEESEAAQQAELEARAAETARVAEAESERKAQRDARYAARKARQGKRR
jgi:uncharacterized protein DUF6481